MPAHWCVELGLVPLVGRAMSRDVFSGGCGLRKTLGSLSADGWGCVPALLVVWPEASQHWSLQAVEWGHLGVKMAISRRAHVNEYSLVPPPPVLLSPQ